MDVKKENVRRDSTSCNFCNRGELKHLGYFKTPLQASKAYQLELKNI